MPVCEIHKCEMKLVPAGISKKTGKPYNAFYACQVQGCTFRPPQPQTTSTGDSRGHRSNSSDASIVRQVAFKGAIEMVVSGKIDIVAVEKYTNIFEDVLLRHKAEPVEELPTINQDEDVPFADDDLPQY